MIVAVIDRHAKRGLVAQLIDLHDDEPDEIGEEVRFDSLDDARTTYGRDRRVQVIAYRKPNVRTGLIWGLTCRTCGNFASQTNRQMAILRCRLHQCAEEAA